MLEERRVVLGKYRFFFEKTGPAVSRAFLGRRYSDDCDVCGSETPKERASLLRRYSEKTANSTREEKTKKKRNPPTGRDDAHGLAQAETACDRWNRDKLNSVTFSKRDPNTALAARDTRFLIFSPQEFHSRVDTFSQRASRYGHRRPTRANQRAVGEHLRNTCKTGRNEQEFFFKKKHSRDAPNASYSSLGVCVCARTMIHWFWGAH